MANSRIAMLLPVLVLGISCSTPPEHDGLSAALAEVESAAVGGVSIAYPRHLTSEREWEELSQREGFWVGPCGAGRISTGRLVRAELKTLTELLRGAKQSSVRPRLGARHVGPFAHSDKWLSIGADGSSVQIFDGKCRLLGSWRLRDSRLAIEAVIAAGDARGLPVAGEVDSLACF